jgi:hypothetical protein
MFQYWIRHNGSNVYSKKLSQLIRKKVKLIQSEDYLGEPTDFENVRVSLISHFSLFYKANKDNIIIVGIWDNRRNPEDLRKNIEL